MAVYASNAWYEERHWHSTVILIMVLSENRYELAQMYAMATCRHAAAQKHLFHLHVSHCRM